MVPMSPALSPDLDVEDGVAVGVAVVDVLGVEEAVVEDGVVVLEATSLLMVKVPPPQQEPSVAK
jgi:tetrahydrodipicolinate N-succinyltransferase